jgi:hypothetical protein
MHDNPLNHEDARTEIDRMAWLDERVVRALEIAPEPQIAADFAVRVASRLPPTRSVSLTPTHYGYYAMLASMVVLLATLLVLASRAADRSMFEVTLQWLLCGQFIGVAVWLSVRRQGVL